MLRRSVIALAGIVLAGPVSAQQPLKIALIYGKTGPLEAYARQTEAGFMLGLEYATQGKMEIGGRKIQVILKDDQLKPDMGKAALGWICGCVTIWSSLFAIGSFLYGRTALALVLSGVFVASGVVLILVINRLWDDPVRGNERSATN